MAVTNSEKRNTEKLEIRNRTKKTNQKQRNPRSKEEDGLSQAFEFEKE